MLERIFRYLTAKLVIVGGVFIVVQAFLLPHNEAAIAWVRLLQYALPLLILLDVMAGLSGRLRRGEWPRKRWAWIVVAAASVYPFVLSPLVGRLWVNAYLFWACWACVPLAVGILIRAQAPLQRNLGFLGIILFLGFSVIEFTLRHVPDAPYTYLEQNTDRPFSPFEKTQDSIYFSPFRLQTVPQEWLAKRGQKRNGEFEQTITYNRLGFNDTEWPDSADDNAEIWLALGDSFTEGSGAGPTGADNWPRLLQEQLRKQNPSLRILNAGMNGADPVFSLGILQQLTPRYRPRKVLLALNSSDMDEIVTRGGLNRTFSKSHIRPFEYGMITSFVFRYYFIKVKKHDYHGKSLEERDRLDKYSLNTLQEVINRMHKWGRQHESEIYCFYLPNYQEMRDTTAKPNGIANLTGVIDLRSCYIKKGVLQNAERYYWPIDRHHTPTGYRVLAGCIAEQLQFHTSGPSEQDIQPSSLKR